MTRIALVLDSFSAPYQAALVRFARQACEQRGLSLVVFPGGAIGGHAASAPRGRIYDLISRDRFDGVVVLAGTMTRDAGLEGLREFCARFRPMPVCSIGARLAGIPSYLVDHGDGMRALARHLLEDHGYRQLAFIGGRVANEEANERLQAFRDELQAHGCELHPQDVVHGDFRSASGQEALRVLLDERRRRPEAIVAANDAMALGVLEALTHYPAELARKIAVCGFDNVIESDLCSPPLTTVAQPLQLLAESAVDGIVAQLSGRAPPELTRFETRPVFRRSCGCGAEQAAPEMQRWKASRGGSVLEFLRHRTDIVSQLSRAAAGAYDVLPRWEEHLLDSFIEQIRGLPNADFPSQVRKLLQHTTLEHHGETWRFHNVISAMRRSCLPCVAGEPAQLARAEDLLQTARTLTGEAVLRGQARRLLVADQQSFSMNNLGTLLADVRAETELRAALATGLSELGIRALAGVEFLGTGEPIRAARAFYFSGEPERGTARSSAFSETFAPQRLVPRDEWLDARGGSWVALPLFYRREPLGYLLAELCLHDGKSYESLRAHVSASLWALRHARSA